MKNSSVMQSDRLLYKCTQKPKGKCVSRRLTIAIPESLYERLQQVKQEINISGVCQEALNMAITLKETNTNSNTCDRQKLIDRLKLEKKLFTAQIKAQGCKIGQKSATTLSYKEFQRIERLTQAHTRIDAGAFADMWQWLAARQAGHEMQFEDDELNELAPLNDENKAIFVEGWIEGVLSVWHQIKDQLDDPEIE
jgi:hypothetical protein